MGTLLLYFWYRMQIHPFISYKSLILILSFSPVMKKVISRRSIPPSTPPPPLPLPHSGTETPPTTPMSTTKSVGRGRTRNRITWTLTPTLTQTVRQTAVIMQWVWMEVRWSWTMRRAPGPHFLASPPLSDRPHNV